MQTTTNICFNGLHTCACPVHFSKPDTRYNWALAITSNIVIILVYLFKNLHSKVLQSITNILCHTCSHYLSTSWSTCCKWIPCTTFEERGVNNITSRVWRCALSSFILAKKALNCSYDNRFLHHWIPISEFSVNLEINDKTLQKENPLCST